ncbi:uncharacterized protein LOC132749172 [Ruditapes philippinarum]|uniref:uncharacterized protein LOC132749172 n=1 Tax=Ruditapes philippinarum TaxID=129788 RepID=UPI00295AD76D|nr:uncharacterized protein LOC132749172 [Ruditapes philippinarum]
MSYLRVLVLAAVAVAVFAAEKRAGCTTNTDCSGITCPHGEKGYCEQVHGTGNGGGELACICKKHQKRAVRANPGCCSAGDCDANALGCDPHHQIATCQIISQHGHCHDNVCKCIQKHNG